MKYAFIGTGSMAAAIIRGMVAGGVAPGDILAFNRTREKADALVNELGIVVCDTLEAAAQAGAIVLATTPQSFADILNGCGDGMAATIQDGCRIQHALDVIIRSAEEEKWLPCD